MRRRQPRKNKPTYCDATRKAKIRYRTLKDAKTARASVAKDDRNANAEIRIYHCRDCGGYHLTSEKEFKKSTTNTVWKNPYETISSKKERFLTEEDPDGRDGTTIDQGGRVSNPRGQAIVAQQRGPVRSDSAHPAGDEEDDPLPPVSP